MKDEAPFQDFPAYSEKSTNKKPLVVFLIILLLIAAGVAGVYFIGRTRGTDSQKAVVPTQAPIPTEVPTSTPVASASGTITPSGKLSPTPASISGQLDRSKLTVVVLNGSGVAGAGRRYSTALSGLGYVVSSTGNADTFDYTGVTVKVKKSKSSYASLLKKDLGTVAAGSTITTSVDDTITTDAAVIIGK
ncbi:MAG TPA: LytR C-terminal domain-containing protein [Candidatus Limnocylindrales bacterium]|nr:LytR C-terminal domain-containing protein [Candidatus Limnocylindrales bacterium]